MRTSTLLLATVLSCAHVQPGAETVAQHRKDAAAHQTEARRERAQYDPSEVRQVPPKPAIMLADQGGEAVGESYNPTSEHLTRADQQMREANEHLVAAKTLLAYEGAACVGLSKGERSSCPMLASSVNRVQDTTRGFLLTIRPDVDVAKTHQQLSCHLAFAIASGFDRPSCPLFIRGTALARVGADGISFISDSPEVSASLRSTARRVFQGVQSASNP